MEEGDAPQSVALTNLMKWGFEEEDFSFMMELEPKGCFVATKGNRIIGVVTSVSFGQIGWVGNVIVAPEERGRGVGAALVSEALNHLKAEDITTIGLYAYRNAVSFYEKLGFKANRDFSWFTCRNVSWTGEKMPAPDSPDLKAILEFDELCFGAPRKKLLKAIYGSPLGICEAILEGGKPTTYLMVAKSSATAEIGPWICAPGQEEDAFRLFTSLGNELQGLEAHVGVPSDRSDIVDFLLSLGFAEDFHVVRMFHGPVPPDRGCVLAMESLERG